jgi:hypothetical protein
VELGGIGWNWVESGGKVDKNWQSERICLFEELNALFASYERFVNNPLTPFS